MGEVCIGYDLRNGDINQLIAEKQINLSYLLNTYNTLNKKTTYFNNFFYRLAGSNTLKTQVESGFTEQQIRASWQKDINSFKKIREQYLLYSDFE